MLFDLDGTLLDSIEGIVASFNHTFSEHLPGHKFSRAEIIATLGIPVPEQMLFFGGAALAEAMADTYRSHNKGLIPHFPLYPHAKAALSELRSRGYITGLVTSKHRDSTQISIESHSLGNLFDLILTATDTAKHKPDPEPLFEASRRLKVEAKDIMYIGDATHDINCAKAAGAMAVAALWGPYDPAILRALGPHYLVASFAELLQLPELLPS